MESLCEICKGIDLVVAESKRGYMHHSNGAALHRAASNGCLLCKAFCMLWNGSIVDGSIVIDVTSQLFISFHRDSSRLCLRTDFVASTFSLMVYAENCTYKTYVQWDANIEQTVTRSLDGEFRKMRSMLNVLKPSNTGSKSVSRNTKTAHAQKQRLYQQE